MAKCTSLYFPCCLPLLESKLHHDLIFSDPVMPNNMNMNRFMKYIYIYHIIYLSIYNIIKYKYTCSCTIFQSWLSYEYYEYIIIIVNHSSGTAVVVLAKSERVSAKNCKNVPFGQDMSISHHITLVQQLPHNTTKALLLLLPQLFRYSTNFSLGGSHAAAVHTAPIRRRV